MPMKWFFRSNPGVWLVVTIFAGLIGAELIPSLLYEAQNPRRVIVHWISVALWAGFWAAVASFCKMKFKWGFVTLLLGMALSFAAMAGRDILWRIYSVRGTEENAAIFVVVSNLLHALIVVVTLVSCSMGVWVIYHLRRAKKTKQKFEIRLGTKSFCL